jgi:hypothetical protein
MKLVSMKQDAKEAAEYSIGAMDPGEEPLYPYGLCIRLSDEGMSKLGMSLPAVGTKFIMTAMVECKSARADAVQDGDVEIATELQITDMAVEPTGKDVAGTLWPDKD